MHDPFKDSPAFKKMIEDTNNERDKFLSKFNKIIPIVKTGQDNKMTVVLDGISNDIPENSLPILYPLAFDDLSLVFGVDMSTHYEWLRNLDIEVANGIQIDEIVEKSYMNLLTLLNDKIQITKLSSDVAMITGCGGLESSLIMIEHIWDQIRKFSGAENLVFGIPTQDVFIFVDVNKTDAIVTVEEQVVKIYNNPQFPKKISSRLYLKKSDGSILKYIK